MAGIYHGYTYSAHPVGAAAALACLAETVRLNVARNAAARGTQFYAGLERLKARHAIVGDVRGGHGLMMGIEMVADPATRAPLDKDTAARIHAAIYEAGVMVRLSGHQILMSPPLIVSEAEVDSILSALDVGMSVV